MSHGKLRGAIARQFWRSRHEETPSQTRRREKAEALSAVREETEAITYEEEARWYYPVTRHMAEFYAEPAPFTTETGGKNERLG